MSKKKNASKSRKHLKTVAAADRANARARDERKAARDGMTASERAMAKSAKAKPAPPKPKRLSGLDAAAQLLAASKEPMGCQALVEQMQTRGLWKSPGGKTPAATLYVAIIREIRDKGKESRFKKTGRGLFATAKGR